MMLITQIRLASHLLGELRPDQGMIRRFKRNRQGNVAVNQKVWLDQFDFAARNLQIDVDCRRTVIPPEAIVPASVHLYRRRYSGVYVELFEAFRPGTVITFDILLRDQLPRCPNLNQLAEVLAFTGERLGLSQFGSKFGFGRFRLVSVRPSQPREPETLAAAETVTGEKPNGKLHPAADDGERASSRVFRIAST